MAEAAQRYHTEWHMLSTLPASGMEVSLQTLIQSKESIKVSFYSSWNTDINSKV